jgi:hypothetical protein
LAAQVLEGLAEGEVVVVHPSDQVAPRVRIKPRRSQSASAMQP